MRIQSIKFKISVLYTIALGLLLVAYSIFLYLTLSQGLTEDLDFELKDKTKQIRLFIDEFHRQTIQDGGDVDKNLNDAANMTINLDNFRLNALNLEAARSDWLKSFDHLDLSEDYIYFADMNTTRDIFTKNITESVKKTLEDAINRKNTGQTFFSDIRLNTEHYRLIQEPYFFKGRLKFIFLVATSQRNLVTVLRERRNLLFLSIPVVLILAILISRYFSNRLVKPIIEIADVAEQVTHKDLSQRIQAKYSDEEIKIIVGAFNKMISRLQRAFGHISQFNSHVAHELKTPISIINGECEVALRKDQTTEEYKETLRAIFEESRKMLKTTEDLLLLARADYTPENFIFNEFDLNEFFEEIYDKGKKLAAEKGVALRIKLPLKTEAIKGDALHLRRLFLNIINNAIKFTEQGGAVDLVVNAEKEKLVVEVSDTGVGIAPDEIPKIFNQFYQKVPTASHPRGVGLGLSIAQAIAKVHNGGIKAQSIVGRGTTFTISLPIVALSSLKTKSSIYHAA